MPPPTDLPAPTMTCSCHGSNCTASTTTYSHAEQACHRTQPHSPNPWTRMALPSSSLHRPAKPSPPYLADRPWPGMLPCPTAPTPSSNAPASGWCHTAKRAQQSSKNGHTPGCDPEPDCDIEGHGTPTRPQAMGLSPATTSGAIPQGQRGQSIQLPAPGCDPVTAVTRGHGTRTPPVARPRAPRHSAASLHSPHSTRANRGQRGQTSHARSCAYAFRAGHVSGLASERSASDGPGTMALGDRL